MDGPLIDLGNSAVWRVIRRAKWRGYITYDELNRLLPPETVSAEQIKDVLEQLQEVGIRAVAAMEVVGSAIPRPANSNQPPPGVR
jgi:RNA polymerase primary sigma factor